MRLIGLVMLVVAILGLGVSVAAAAPTEETLSVTELQALLESSGGTLDGHMSTVMRGSTIVDIDVDVLAVTYGTQTGPDSLSALIVFEASGPDIDRIGGIASGMSGSPIYVDDGTGTDKLVGALSYGDSMTLGGTGLATPIDAMSLVEEEQNLRPVTIQSLTAPVLTGAGLKDKIIITTDPEDYADEAVNGAIVAEPLASMFVGGISPSSRIYKDYSAYLEKRGVKLTPLAGGMSAMTSPYDAEFEAGSAIASLASRGDLWVGGIGTTTYVNGDNVLAFGHPMFWAGGTNLFMCNAWVDYVWPSTYAPYKVARPAALRGTITQDRTAGIMGVDGDMPTEIPITAKATNLKTGVTEETTVTMPAGIINSSSMDYYGIPSLGAYVAGSRVFDQYSVIGSAHTTTTVVVSDGTTTYEIVRPNIVDNEYDVLSSVVNDVDSIVSSLQYVGTNGIATPFIQSVDVESAITTDRELAQVVAVNVAGGLRHGTNNVVVSYLEWGKPTTQTVGVTLNIPSNVPLTGTLDAYSTDGPSSDEEEGASIIEMLFNYEDNGPSGWVDRSTVKEVVDDLKAQPSNGLLTVSFQPVVAAVTDPESGASSAAVKKYEPIEVTKLMDAYLVGSAFMEAPQIEAFFDPSSTVGYWGTTWVVGELSGTDYGTGTIKVTRQYAGETAVNTVATVSLDEDGFFSAKLSGLKKNATIRLMYSGDSETLQTSKTLYAKVAAKVSLKSSSYKIKRGKRVTLTATLQPADTNGKVVFERYTNGYWKQIATRTIYSGKATYSYKAPLGTTKIRARTTGSTKNVAGKSSTIKVKVVK